MTELLVASGRGGGVSLMLGLPFSETLPRSKGTQSLPDARTLRRQRAQEIITEKGGMNRPKMKLDENLF